jgi:glycogen(starch) synthase
MKVLIYSHYFAPSIGGVESIVEALATGLAKLRTLYGDHEFDVIVVTEIPAENFSDESFAFRVVRQPGLMGLWRLIEKSDVVHAAGPALLPIFFGWLLRKRVVIEHHTYQSVCPNGLLLQRPKDEVCPGHFQAGRYRECLRCLRTEVSGVMAIKRMMLMFPRYRMARAASVNLAVSKHVRDRLKLPNTTVVYHGIEDAPEDAGTGATTGVKSFAYVGRFVTEKGLPILLQACKILRDEGKDFRVQLIGDGPERGKLEEIILREQLAPWVSITGFLTGHALAKTLSEIQVVVTPSICEETAGLATMEQMMRGRLVIASSIGGLREIVEGAGLLSVPGDENSLADAMRKAIEDPTLMNSLGEKGRKRASDMFTRQRMIEEHARIYRGFAE